jgi:hypothetical protein
LAPLDPLPGYTVAVIGASGLTFENYGKGLGPAVQHNDPEASVRRRCEPVLNELKKQFSGVAGIAFTHKR